MSKNRRINIKYKRRRKCAILGLMLCIICIIGTKLNSKIENLVTDKVSNTNKKNNRNKEFQGNNEELVYKAIVVIDPGHGGGDGGAISNCGCIEKDITLDVGLRVGKMLEKQGVYVVYTRDSDNITFPNEEQQNLEARAGVANEISADALISIHCNFLEDTSVKGVETWCRFEGTPGETLAKCILDELDKVNYTDKRTVKYEYDGTLGILRASKVPTALIELGFLSNEEDVKVMNSIEGKNKLSKAISIAVLNYLKLKT